MQPALDALSAEKVAAIGAALAYALAEERGARPAGFSAWGVAGRHRRLKQPCSREKKS